MAQQKKHGSTRHSSDSTATRAPKRRQEAPSSATPTMNERMRRSGKWVFLGLAVVFGFSFVCHQVGSFLGIWVAGRLYDHYGYYAPAFGSGVAFNLVNLAIIGFLVFRTARRRPGLAVPA